MPFYSKAQQGFMYAEHPEIAAHMEDTTDAAGIDMKTLPKHSKNGKPVKKEQAMEYASIFKGIAKRKDVKPAEGEDKYGNVTFADPVNKKYPIDSEEHIRAAWNYINKPDDAGKYSAEDAKAIKDRIIAAWKKSIDPAGPPSAATKEDSTMTLANIFKKSGTPVQKSQKAATAMVLRKVVAKSETQKKLEETHTLAGDLGVGSVFKR